MFLKNRNISSKIKRSKVTDYAALKVLSSYKNALCDSSKLFLQQFTLETWGFWIFSAKCDVILSFRRISFKSPRLYAHASLIRFRLWHRDTYMY